MKRWHLAVSIILLTALPVLAACGDNDDDDPTATTVAPTAGATGTPELGDSTEPLPEPTSTPEPQPATPTNADPAPPATATSTNEILTLSVYFIRDEKLAAAHREIPHTLDVGAASMEQLLAGPTDLEAEYGFTSAVPAGTQFLGLEIVDGVAKVDLSAEFESGGGSFSVAARLAQVTFTLTQFPTVDAVEFFLEGKPVEVFSGEGLVLDHPADRKSFEELLPAIFVESPVAGDEVESPLHVWGTANTFEATFMLNVVDPEGLIIAEEVVTASSGSGTRGTFDVTVEFETTRQGIGALIAFENSARDGEPINIVEIPVDMGG